ncbi:MAG TPA: hypothetical protein VK156_02320, partial [Candidatus Limnocylindria bacterium]|nr:hypothetical protein [Candidatus Limnocylindria bacterium]
MLERTRGLLQLAAVCALALVFFLTGCGKKEKPLTPAQIHAITRELQAAVPRDPSQYGRVWATTRKTAANDGATDHLYVTVLPGDPSEGHSAGLTDLLQSLDRVATRYKLTRDPLGNDAGNIQFLFRHDGAPTHTIHILTAQAAQHAGTSPEVPASGARLAIIIDDMGYDQASADAVFALQYPLTLS